MSDERTIKPADGRRVRYPDTGRVMGPEGDTVAWGSYWHRRLDAGDVVEVDAPAPDASAAPAKAAPAKGAAPAPQSPAPGAAATAAPDPAATAAVKDA